MDNNSHIAEEAPSITIWQIVMLFLCIYVLGAVLVDTVFTLSPETSRLLNLIDTIICVIFIGDFFVNLIKAKNKPQFLKWGWIDLVSSIPNLEILRWGRFTRIVRIVRILRGMRSTRMIVKVLFANRVKGSFSAVAAISFILVVFSTIAMLNCETWPESNIKTAGDSLWWAFSTITTVGYGDRYPVTPMGRIVAVLLMTAGVGMFGTFTAYIATLFFKTKQDEVKERENVILAELQEIKQRLDRIEKSANLTRDSKES